MPRAGSRASRRFAQRPACAVSSRPPRSPSRSSTASSPVRPSTSRPDRPGPRRQGPGRHPGRARRGHHRPARARCAARDAYLRLVGRARGRSGSAPGAEMSVKLSAFGQALPGGHELALANVAPGRRGRRRDRHDGHPRHGGPHHRRLHARRSTPSCAKDFPQTGCGRPVLPASAPRTTPATSPPPARRVRLVKGAYKEPADRRLPGQARGRQGVRPLPEDPDGRRGLPDDRLPRPADDRHRARSSPPRRAASSTSTSSRCCTASASDEQRAAGRRRAPHARLHRRTAPTGTDTSCAASPSARPTSRSSCARSSPWLTAPGTETRSENQGDRHPWTP